MMAYDLFLYKVINDLTALLSASNCFFYPVDGQWSLWSKYTSCTLTCGKGYRQRTRVCAAPRPKYGGKDCIGNSTDIQECYGHYPCPGRVSYLYITN